MLNAACEQCRLRKVRCDGLQPCTPCTRVGRREECFRRSRKKRTASRPGDGSRTTDRVRHEVRTSRHATRSEDQHRPRSTSPFWPFERPRNAEGLSDEQTAAAATLESLRGLPLAEQARRMLVDEQVVHDTISFLYHWRISPLVFASVFIPDVLRLLRRLFSGTEDHDIADADIALLLAMVASGLRSIPRVYTSLTSSFQGKLDRMRMTFKKPSRARELASAARSILLDEIRTEGRSLTHIQAICVLLHFDTDGGNTNEQLFDHAVRTMRKWPFHHFNSTIESKADAQNELTVRCWWFIVCRDWLGAVATGAYSIQPSHFSCRLPLEVSDVVLDRYSDVPDAQRKQPNERGEYFPVPYSLTIIRFAMMVRRLVDLRVAKGLDSPAYSDEVVREFESFCIGLPDAYSLQRSRAYPDLLEEMPRALDAKTTTERWLIHQQCFYTLVELHSPVAILTPSRIAVPLAQHILEIRQDMEYLCSVTDLFRFKATNAVNACIVLLLHLMQTHRDGSLTFIARDLILGKIRKTVNGSKGLSKSHGEAFTLVNELLKIEAQAWGGSEPTTASYDDGSRVAPAPPASVRAASKATAVSSLMSVPQILQATFPPLVSSPASSATQSVSTTTYDSAAVSRPPSTTLSALNTPPELDKFDAVIKVEDRKDPDWLSTLPSDLAISTLFQPPADDPSGTRFYDAIRSTLLWTEGGGADPTSS